MIKHETVNSLFSGLALLISGLAYYGQYLDNSDELSIVVKDASRDYIVNVIKDVRYYDDETDTDHPVVGPLLYRIQIFNPTNRNVTITDHEVFPLNGKGDPDFYFGYGGNLLNFDDFRPIPITVELPPGQARFFWLKINIPIISTESLRQECLVGDEPLYDIEWCFLNNGYDIFGNKVQRDFVSPLYYHAQADKESGPSFELKITTGDGTDEKAVFHYY